jgi:enoyl-CoA hydratase/carnithine racemase
VSDISIRVEGRAGRITLTRPRALNALTYDMARTIDETLALWAHDPAVALVLIDGEGDRAFCAGGDVREIYDRGRIGDFHYARRFWSDEYRMNALIAGFPKPYVALAHGLVMGGGVGISVHGSHRVVCETSRIAMPECAIGLVPDVGGTAVLAAAPGRLGEYLGLTGHQMEPGDAIRAGFADHFVARADWPGLVAALVETGDPAAIASVETPAPADRLSARADAIDDAFSAPDLATLIARLETSDWGHEVLGVLRGKSPLSLACTLELVRAARSVPGIDAALRREYRCTWRCISDGDLLEGIRAQVIDKDRAPRWQDPIDGVTAARVAAMLAPLDADELVLPADQAAARI